MEEVAEMSGFNSLSTFHRSFQKVIGMTPQQYRNSACWDFWFDASTCFLLYWHLILLYWHSIYCHNAWKKYGIVYFCFFISTEAPSGKNALWHVVFSKILSLNSNHFRFLLIFARFFAFGRSRRIFVEYHSIKPVILCFLVGIWTISSN